MTWQEMSVASIMLVFVRPAQGMEAEFNDWYDNVHAAEALATPGMLSIARYQLSEVAIFPGTELDAPAWVTVYEVEGDSDDDFERITAALRALFLGGDDTAGKHIAEIDIAPVIDMSVLKVAFARELSPRRTLATISRT